MLNIWRIDIMNYIFELKDGTFEEYNNVVNFYDGDLLYMLELEIGDFMSAVTLYKETVKTYYCLGD